MKITTKIQIIGIFCNLILFFGGGFVSSWGNNIKDFRNECLKDIEKSAKKNYPICFLEKSIFHHSFSPLFIIGVSYIITQLFKNKLQEEYQNIRDQNIREETEKEVRSTAEYIIGKAEVTKKNKQNKLMIQTMTLEEIKKEKEITKEEIELQSLKQIRVRRKKK